MREVSSQFARQPFSRVLPGPARRIRRVTRARTEGASVSSRIRLSLLGLPGAIVLLVAVAAPPAGALTQPSHRPFAAPAVPIWRGTELGNGIAPHPRLPVAPRYLPDPGPTKPGYAG